MSSKVIPVKILESHVAILDNLVEKKQIQNRSRVIQEAVREWLEKRNLISYSKK